MLQSTDKQILDKKGISVDKFNEQLQSFVDGFPYLEIIRAAEPGHGISLISNSLINDYLLEWDSYLKSDATILKFVPASGAASRMFKDLFEFLDGDHKIPEKKAELQFFSKIEKFAFFDDLNAVCIKNNGKGILELKQENKFKPIVANLLLEEGLNYGSLPKGLLKFHAYANEVRTPMLEHLVEGSLYAMNKNNLVNIHFTVSGEHRSLFESHLAENLAKFEAEFDAIFKIDFSEQKPSTDTIAAGSDNQPFRDNDQLVFRPGGHGALIENLNDLDADVIFIKNIDNVVPDALKNPTIIYKKVIAGLLVKLQKQCFVYLGMLENNEVSTQKFQEIKLFCQKELNIQHPDLDEFDEQKLKNFLFEKLNRPLRICGMVKNTGEPGGGPFLTVDADGSISTQILESSQIDVANPVEKAKLTQSTHFNPVDLVCAVKDYKGNKFNLANFVDKKTGFISNKSKGGKELKALELPGLWNGAMSNWITVFAEVPIATFNPVKTVNDLLRPEHQ
jgi:hypothetical protein